MQQFRILALGDVVGAAALALLRKRLPALRRELSADLVIVNAENAHAGLGNGTGAEDAALLLASGADVLTGGNHSLRQRSYDSFTEAHPEALRPLNFSPEAPGHGDTVIDAAGVRVLVLNAMGRVFMDPCDEPFRAIEKALERNAGKYDLSVLDFHAEATSEKFAVAKHFDGKINLIFGSHTHVPTADERLLPGGSCFITDLGMCGPRNSCLGMEPTPIITKMRSGIPQKFELSANPIGIEGILVCFEGTGFGPLRPVSIERISE